MEQRQYEGECTALYSQNVGPYQWVRDKLASSNAAKPVAMLQGPAVTWAVMLRSGRGCMMEPAGR